MNAERKHRNQQEENLIVVVGTAGSGEMLQRERCVLIAEAMLAECATVRKVAGEFGISKSTVHKDLTERLPHVHAGLYAEVRELLLRNKAERHLRGGEATKRKYLKHRETS